MAESWGLYTEVKTKALFVLYTSKRISIKMVEPSAVMVERGPGNTIGDVTRRT